MSRNLERHVQAIHVNPKQGLQKPIQDECEQAPGVWQGVLNIKERRNVKTHFRMTHMTGEDPGADRRGDI